MQKLCCYGVVLCWIGMSALGAIAASDSLDTYPLTPTDIQQMEKCRQDSGLPQQIKVFLGKWGKGVWKSFDKGEQNQIALAVFDIRPQPNNPSSWQASLLYGSSQHGWHRITNAEITLEDGTAFLRCTNPGGYRPSFKAVGSSLKGESGSYEVSLPRLP